MRSADCFCLGEKGEMGLCWVVMGVSYFEVCFALLWEGGVVMKGLV